MRIDILGLQGFIAVADTGSFVAAAEALNLSQAALSHRIAKLEGDLGVPLLARTTRRLSLTAHGLELLPRARAAVAELSGVLSDLRQQGELKKRQVSFGCIPTIASGVLVPVLARFAEGQPDVRLRVHDGYASAVADMVRSEQLDFGLIVRRGTHFETDFEPLRREGFVVLCRPEHPLAQRDRVRLDDLQGHCVIGNSVVADALREVDDWVEWRYRVETVATAVAFVRGGAGITLVPALVAEPAAGRGLASIPVAEQGLSRIIGLVSRPDMRLSAPAALLMDLLRERLRDGSIGEAG